MKKIFKHAAACSIIGLLACTPVLGQTDNTDSLTDESLTLNNNFTLKGQDFLLASADTSGGAGQAAGAAASGEKKKPTQAEIAEAINNPLSSLWLLFTQNDTKWYGGTCLTSLVQVKR